MPYPLTTSIHETIFNTLHQAFRELPFYAKVVEVKMRKVIQDTDSIDIDHRVHKRLTERYFDVVEFNKTETGKVMLTQIHIIIRAAYVLVLAYHPDKQSLLWDDVETLLKHYPEFRDQDEQEQRYLLQFRNMMKLALLVVPPRLNKKLLINIAARLEGSGKEYITGGGQKPCVTRRVMIYEREGNVEAEKRDKREKRDPALVEITGKKRPQLNTSFKKIKLIRIASDEAQNYIRNPVHSANATELLTLSRADSSATTTDTGCFSSAGTSVYSNSFSFSQQPLSTASVPVVPSSSSSTGNAISYFDDMMGFSTTASFSSYQPISDQSSSYIVTEQGGFSGELGTQVPLSLAQPQTMSIASTAEDDFEDLLNFPPGLLSRQQSEWLTNFAQGLSNGTIGGECHVNPGLGGDAGYTHTAGSDAVDESAAIILPMLRAVSWDVGTISFVQDLANILSN